MPQTADITQACFLSGMFYFMFLPNCRLDKQGSNLHQGSEYKAPGVRQPSPPPLPHHAPESSKALAGDAVVQIRAPSSLPSLLKQ